MLVSYLELFFFITFGVICILHVSVSSLFSVYIVMFTTYLNHYLYYIISEIDRENP